MLYSTCLNLKLSTNLWVTVVRCVRARKRSYTLPDACQHARDFVWKASESSWVVMKGMMRERDTAWETTPFASISSYHHIYR